MKNMLKVMTVALLLVGLLMFGAACGNTQEAAEEPEKIEDQAGEQTTEKAQEPKELVIGFTGPLSGPAAQYGQDVLNGLDFAVNDINSKGGFTVDGQPYIFKLEAMDDQADPTQTINNVRRMRDQFDVPTIFNPVFHSIAPMTEINMEEGNEFLIMAYSSTPEILHLDNELTVRIPPSFLTYVKAFVNDAWEEGWRKGAMLVTLGGYGDEWRAAFQEQWEHKGGEIVADQPANYYAETDYSTQLSAVIAKNPDFILIGGPSEPTALVIEQARELGYEGPLMLVDQAKIDNIEEVLGGTELMHNVMGVPATGDVGTKTAQAFKSRYEKTYNTINTWEAVWNYNSIYVLARAMEEAGSVDDPMAIREAFPKAFPLSGEEFPQEMYGIGDRGEIFGYGGVQKINDSGEYTTPTDYVWWTDSQEDFEKILEFTQADNVELIDIEE